MESGVAVGYAGVEASVGEAGEGLVGVAVPAGVPALDVGVAGWELDGESDWFKEGVGVVGDGELFVVDVSPWA